MKRSCIALSYLALALILTVSLPIGAEKTTIQHLAHTPNVVEQELYGNLAASSFRSEHPDIEIEILAPGAQGWVEKLITMVAGGISPDTVFCANWWIPEMVEKGLFLDIQEYVARDKTWSDDNYFPVTTAQTFYKGGRYAVPRHFSPMLMFFNRDLLRMSGLTDPPADWTWSEFEVTARRLTQSSDGVRTQWGFSPVGPNDLTADALTIPIVRSFGGDLFSQDGTRLALTEPKSIEAVQWLIDLSNVQHVAPMLSESSGGGFSGGRIGMHLNAFYRIMQLRSANVAFDWDVAQVPRGPVGRVNRGASGVHAVVSTSKHPEEAWQWIKFLAGREAQLAFASSGLVMGARRDSAIVKTLTRDDTPPKNISLFLDAAMDAWPYPATPYFNQAVAAIRPAMNVAWRGEKSFRVAINEVKDQVELILQGKTQ
jgi:multiple sugar transport system substrate-binding protein